MRRHLYIDYLRFIAVIGVISIHVVASIVLNFKKYGTYTWWVGNVIDGGFHFAVPIFVMISGALLLSSKKDMTLWEFYKSRLSRILFPFLCAVVFYFFWEHRKDLPSIGDALKEILRGPVYYHLWYVYMILGLILVTPILKILTRHASKQVLHLFIGVWLVSQLDGFLKYFFKVDIGLSFRVTTDFVGYFVMGYYIHTYAVSKPIRRVIYALGVASLLGIWFGTYGLLKDNGGKFIDFLYQDNSFTITLVAIALFLAVRNIDFKRTEGIVPTFVFAVGKYSYGIYLVHVIIKELLIMNFNFNFLYTSPIAGYFVLLSLILFISLVLTWGAARAIAVFKKT